MNPEFLKEIEAKLEQEHEELLKEIEKIAPQAATEGQPPSVSYPNFGDREDESASEVAQFSDNLSLEQTLEKSLRDVEEALARMKNGTYGKCKYCEQEIDERRLQARPTSSSCISCKKTFTQEV